MTKPPATRAHPLDRTEPTSVRREEVPASLGGLRADQALARMFPEHSRSRLQMLARAGRVTLDGRPADPARKVWGGEQVVLALAGEEGPLANRAEPIPLEVMFEDDALLVIDKPAGLVVHPGNGNRTGTLLNALLAHAPTLAGVARAGIVHRLDKDTSGLMVIAKTPAAHTQLVRALQARTVERTYLALVHGAVPRDGAVEAPIGRDPRTRTRMAVVARGREARTHYRIVRRYSAPREFTLLECRLDTGRTHQIRVHMRAIGHPLVGDPTYGARGQRSLDVSVPTLRRQALHACRLALMHPVTGEGCAWKAPPPADFAGLLDALR